MRIVGLHELRTGSATAFDRLATDGTIVTRRGKPVALLVQVDEESTLAYLAEGARGEFPRKGGIGHRAMRQRTRRR